MSEKDAAGSAGFKPAEKDTEARKQTVIKDRLAHGGPQPQAGDRDMEARRQTLVKDRLAYGDPQSGTQANDKDAEARKQTIIKDRLSRTDDTQASAPQVAKKSAGGSSE